MQTRLSEDLFTLGPELHGPGFHVQQVDYSPGYRREPHAHDSTGLTLIVDGEFRETAHGREEFASELSVVVKPAGTVHADVVGPRGARTVSVQIEDTAALLAEPEELGPWRWLHAGPGVQPLLGLRQALLDPAGGPEAEEVVLELLAEVIDAPGLPPLGAPLWVRRAREALDDQAAEASRVGDLARLLRVHPVSLSRAFRRAYGVPVSTYRRTLRLRRAATQLMATDRRLATIAHATGFADQAHLCREIRGATGFTPLRLRELARH